jgi:hypothetical protein
MKNLSKKQRKSTKQVDAEISLEQLNFEEELHTRFKSRLLAIAT